MFKTTRHQGPKMTMRSWVSLHAGRTGALLAGMSLVLGLVTTPVAAVAAEEDRVGSNTTLVTVVASDANLRFKVPTVIPFVAASDGTLTGPSPEATKIENLSAFGLKVTNIKIKSENGWNHTSDVNDANNSIDWLLGPRGSMIRASDAAGDSGMAISDPLWNMTYYNTDANTDDITLVTTGNVGRVTQDISSPVHIGTVTFTIAPGAHAATQDGPQTDGGLS